MFIIFTNDHITCAITKDLEQACSFVELLKELGINAYMNKLEE